METGMGNERWSIGFINLWKMVGCGFWKKGWLLSGKKVDWFLEKGWLVAEKGLVGC